VKTFKLSELTLNDRQLPVEAYINPRAKKIKLRFSRDFKSIILTIPHLHLRKEALHFLDKSRGWIEKHLPDHDQLITLTPGSTIQYLGEQVKLLHQTHTRKSVWEATEQLTIFSPPDAFEKVLLSHFKKKLRSIVTELVETHIKALNVTYNKLYIRDSRSNWGCCSHQKNLSFSWRLIYTPVEVIDYLVAHEVSHLIEMNHSKKFWALVNEICPNYSVYRQWLRQNGKFLI